ncbi:MAG: peptide methionine sulfoxide reductase [Bacteroidota bacterium]
MKTLREIVSNIPLGYSEVFCNGKKYSLTRKDFSNGNSIKVYAEELGGTDFISFNYYLGREKEFFKPCEMPESKVLDFLKGMNGND